MTLSFQLLACFADTITRTVTTFSNVHTDLATYGVIDYLQPSGPPVSNNDPAPLLYPS
jgi:hypothetical protein